MTTLETIKALAWSSVFWHVATGILALALAAWIGLAVSRTIAARRRLAAHRRAMAFDRVSGRLVFEPLRRLNISTVRGAAKERRPR